MEKALECFWEAFLTEGDENELICYLLAYKKAKKPQEYEKKLASLNVSEEVKQKVKEALEYFEKEKEEPVKQENIDEMLEKLTGEYHRSTGV